MEHLSRSALIISNAWRGRTVEMAIFNLYNRILESGKTRLLITGDRPPRQLNLGLPDLASRLDWGKSTSCNRCRMKTNSALQLRAKQRGFELPEDVGRFLLKRPDREMRTLFDTLDQLDRASITAQRKLTIPFVKDILKLCFAGWRLRLPGLRKPVTLCRPGKRSATGLNNLPSDAQPKRNRPSRCHASAVLTPQRRPADIQMRPRNGRGQKWCSSHAAEALIAALLVGVLHRSAIALSVCFLSLASSGRDHTSSPLRLPASVSA